MQLNVTHYLQDFAPVVCEIELMFAEKYGMQLVFCK